MNFFSRYFPSIPKHSFTNDNIHGIRLLSNIAMIYKVHQQFSRLFEMFNEKKNTTVFSFNNYLMRFASLLCCRHLFICAWSHTTQKIWSFCSTPHSKLRSGKKFNSLKKQVSHVLYIMSPHSIIPSLWSKRYYYVCCCCCCCFFLFFISILSFHLFLELLRFKFCRCLYWILWANVKSEQTM